MRFVADDQVPIRSGFELGLQVVRPCSHVQSHDQATALGERVASDGIFYLVAGEDVEGQPEFFGHLVLPLLDQTARGDNQAAFKVATDHQLLDQEACHDRLPGAGIIREKEPERLARQHFAVDGCDLMGESVDLGRAYGEVGVEQMCEPQAVGLRR